MQNKSLKLSVITITYNSSKTVEETIESVLSQDYNNIEYVFIDGNSSDNTVDIINSYIPNFEKKQITYKIISEPDNGIYDAMNKGVKNTTGDVICILNSDDVYYENDVLSCVAKGYENIAIDIVYGNLIYVNEQDKMVRNWKSNDFKPGLFKKSWAPPHPTFSCRRKIYDKYGLYDDTMRIAADVDFMFRVMEINNVNSLYIDKYFVRMKQGGLSNSSIKSRFKSFRENLSMFKKYKYKINKLTYFFHKFMKVTQFFKKKTN